MLLNRPQFQLQIWEKIFNLKKKKHYVFSQFQRDEKIRVI